MWVLPMCLAKLQVKPNTATRRGTRAKEETPAISSKETTSTPISTPHSQETSAKSVQEQHVQASILTKVSSDTLAVTSDGETPCSSSSNFPALLKDSHQHANQDNTSHESVKVGPSQSIMGQVDLAGKDAVELAETEAGGSQSQDVSQIASVATSGPFTRWVT